jgi:D-alanine-D-alanine ligase
MEFVPVNASLGLQDPNKIWLTDYFDTHEIIYTGSSRAAYELQRDKPLAKQRILDAGLSTAPFCVIKQNQLPARHDIPLAFPLFVKPTSRGGGLGVDSDSVVYDFGQLLSKVQSITTRLQSDSLVEEYLPGREFSVAILKEECSTKLSAMPIELIAPPDKQAVRILSGRVKSSNTEQALRITDEGIKSKMATLGLDIFYALGGRDFGRIDIRLDKYGTPQFLEANLIPSLISGYGSFPKACILNMNLGYESMIMRIVRLGLTHNMGGITDVLEPSTASSIILPLLNQISTDAHA